VTKPAFLLDTNICIYILADARGAAAIRLAQCPVGSVVASAVSYAEVLKGVRPGGPDAGAAVARFFEKVEVVGFDENAAIAYAGLPFRRGSFDRLIAAQALSLDLVLVTNNERDFRDLPGLRVENWAREGNRS
jgi:tRNA(fMet)-specific endonuclease VapC